MPVKPSPEPVIQDTQTSSAGLFLPRLRLRTRFLLSMALVTAALTTTSLLLVRRSILNNVRQSIAANLSDSVNSFQDFRHERETILTSNVALLADQPLTRAIMTSTDPVTIQDASQDIWQHARSSSDLFVLVDRGGKVVAMHTKTPGFTREAAEKYFQQSLDEDSADSSHWWFGVHHLYQTFVQPIYRGPTTEGTLLGFLVIGYEINDRLAGQVSKVAGGPVAFSYGDEVVATTLDASQVKNPNLQSLMSGAVQGAPHDINIGKESFLATSLLLSGSRSTPVRLGVLGSYDQATKFIDQLNRYLLLLGLAAVLIGSGLVYFLSHTFTRPLGNLVAGVRALGAGDFHHPLDSSLGRDEVAELTRAFDRMRASLLKTQRDLLESEQLATIGRMASSISHDLRHSLAAIVANSEFLCDPHLTPNQREELYQEVRTGVNLMTDLIDSLLEFARTRESLTPVFGTVGETIHRAANAVRLHPRHHNRSIDILCGNNVSGWFDPRKLERALYNLLLNACEAAPAVGGLVEVTAGELDGSLTISVADNGPGIADSIRDRLFHPFVSFGKENGTGLGLAVVQKIVQDHGGEIVIERTAQGRTIFRIALPGRPTEAHRGATEIRLPSLVAAPRQVSNHSISHPEV